MATQQDVIDVARGYLRDFPRFFQHQLPKVGLTYDLKHENVVATDLYVALVTSSSTTALTSSQYQLLPRDGKIRIDQSVDMADVIEVLVEGTYYEWLLPEDLVFYSQMAIDMHKHNLSTDMSQWADAVTKVVGLAALCQALWGLMTQYARDVDVIASESVHIPASQRFRMVQSLLSQYMDEYDKYAKALNIGLDRLEVLNLRRRSRTTERLVPLYAEREIGDFGPWERLWPEPDKGVLVLSDEDDELREEVLVDGEPPSGLTNSSYFPGANTGYY